jgi:hypothetical protein
MNETRFFPVPRSGNDHRAPEWEPYRAPEWELGAGFTVPRSGYSYLSL